MWFNRYFDDIRFCVFFAFQKWYRKKSHTNTVVFFVIFIFCSFVFIGVSGQTCQCIFYRLDILGRWETISVDHFIFSFQLSFGELQQKKTHFAFANFILMFSMTIKKNTHRQRLEINGSWIHWTFGTFSTEANVDFSQTVVKFIPIDMTSRTWAGQLQRTKKIAQEKSLF